MCAQFERAYANAGAVRCDGWSEPPALDFAEVPNLIRASQFSKRRDKEQTDYLPNRNVVVSPSVLKLPASKLGESKHFGSGSYCRNGPEEKQWLRRPR
jgi:hypothetical protein